MEADREKVGVRKRDRERKRGGDGGLRYVLGGGDGGWRGVLQISNFNPLPRCFATPYTVSVLS